MFLVLVVLPLPEALLAIARSVVVRWAGPVPLFSLVCATEENLKDSRNQKEESRNVSQKQRLEYLGIAYAPMMATMNVTLSNWQETWFLGPIGELLTPVHL